MFIIGVVLVSIILVVFVVYKLRPKQKTLYERLGGVYAIAAVVDHFSDALIDNPIVGKNSSNPYLREWHRNKLDRLAGLKFMRTLWVCSISGGPFQYSPTVPGKCPFSLENAHMGLKITSAEFDAVAEELVRSLDHFGVPAQEKSEVLAAFAAHKPDVTMGSTNINPKTLKCPFGF
jgi:hemoglobin